jgi:excisionase family DNA binding protein
VEGERVTSLLRAEEVAAMLAMSPRAVYDLAAKGELAAIRIGRVIRFSVDDVERFVDEHRERAGQSAEVVRLERDGAAP